MQRYSTLSTALCLACCTAIGCQDASPDSPQEGGESTGAISITDTLGRKVTIQQPAQRIISISPRNTELVYAVGAGERVVGVTTFCNYPSDVESVEKVGGFSEESISLEKVVELKPDLIVAATDLHERIIRRFESLGLPVVALSAESVDELFGEISILGRLTGNEQEATRMVQSLSERVRRIRTVAEKIADADRCTVMYQVWDQPLQVAGPACYLGEAIELCGGINILPEKSARYEMTSAELIITRNPDVILAPSGHAATNTVESIRTRAGWENVSAVKNGRIYLIEDDLVSRCGPRFVDGLEAMARVLYPAHFSP